MWVRASTVFRLTSRKTEIARSARGPKLQGPRAEDVLVKSYFVQKIFGGLITADHKVLSEGCESRNNHRYAVVVQDLATQWIQSYPCKTKTSQETERSLQQFLGSQKSFSPPIPWSLAKPVKIYHGIIELRHLIDLRRMVLVQGRYAE